MSSSRPCWKVWDEFCLTPVSQAAICFYLFYVLREEGEAGLKLNIEPKTMTLDFWSSCLFLPSAE